MALEEETRSLCLAQPRKQEEEDEQDKRLRTVFWSRQAWTHKAKEKQAAQAEICGEKKFGLISRCFYIYKTYAY